MFMLHSFFPHLIAAHWRHSRCAQVAGVPVVLVVYLIILTVRAVVVIFSREAPLNAFVHCGTLQSLFRHLALVVQALIH